MHGYVHRFCILYFFNAYLIIISQKNCIAKTERARTKISAGITHDCVILNIIFRSVRFICS